MSAPAHTFPSPPLYSAEASSNPMLAFADIALAYTPTIFSTPRTATLATAPVASTSTSYSPPTSGLMPVSSPVNLPNGAPNGEPSNQLSEAPSTSYRPRPLPPLAYHTVSVDQSPKRTSKRTRRRKKAGDGSARGEVAVKGTPRSTRGDRGRGRGRPSSNIRWVNSSPTSEHGSAPPQSSPMAQYFHPPEAELPSPSPAYSPYPSRPATPVTAPQGPATFIGFTVARDNGIFGVYPEPHSGSKTGTGRVDEPTQPSTEYQVVAVGQETCWPTPGSKVESGLLAEESNGHQSPEKTDAVSTEISTDTVPYSTRPVGASVEANCTVSQQLTGGAMEPTIGITATKELDAQHAPAALEALAASNVNAISLPAAPEPPQDTSTILGKREQSPEGGLTGMKDAEYVEDMEDLEDLEDVALVSTEREADIPKGSELDKLDITEDTRESDEMMIDTEPTASPSVARDKGDLIPPAIASDGAGAQSLEAGVAKEGQPVESNEHNFALIVSETLEEPRTIREGSIDYEVENAYQAGDEPVFGAGGAVEVGIPLEVISPEEPTAGVSVGASESITSDPGQDKLDGPEYQRLRVLSPTGESPREPENPSDEKCETCRGPYQDGHGFRFDQIAWICCDGCGTWHHSRCVGLDSETVNKIDKFYCSRCAEVHGPSTMKRKSSRATTAIDYNALHNGSSAPIKNPVDGKLHPYVEIIRNRTFTFADDKLPRMRPEQVTVEFLEDLPNGWNQPFIVPAESNPAPSATPGPPYRAESRLPEMTLDNGDFDPAEVDRLKQTLREGEYDVKQRRPGADNLDMIIPPGLTVRRVGELIGESARVEMINVLRQATEKDDKWQMEQLVSYFESDVRDVIYNCISCEVSNSELGALISRPQVVRDLDLADKVWRPDPAPPMGSEAKPRVGKYILMSVADSFTDFHIDFAGSSVFYHIYEGEKVFLVIPPTEHNLEIYEKWSMDPNMNTTFFPTLISDPCTLVTLNKGDTMFIPSGWIHAVYTPRDSLVVGGNFLTRNHYAMQMKVQRIEVVTDTKLSQRYPKYTTLMWHLAYNYMTKDPISDEVDEALGHGRVLKRMKQRSPKTARTYTQQELEGLPALCNFLLRTALVSCGTVTTSLVPRRPNLTGKQIDAVKKAIPPPINQEPVEWIKRFGRWCVWKRACQRLVPGGERVPEWALESWWPKDGPKKGPSQAALRRAQRAREEEARKAEPPRRPGLRVRVIRAETTPSFAVPETLTPSTDPTPSTNGTTTATTTTTASITSTGKKADYPRLTHRAPKPKVTYTKTTKTVKRKEDEDRISPPATAKLAKSISPGLTSGGRSGSSGSGKSMSPALAEEDLQVEEIKRMAAKEEFGLRVRRSS
ncbi:hypothetical protein C7212DRAFT_362348 [Tuber magnatum]|uniref:JmjC domain-containing histone demethylation protein 1 n=1 Tax=Tuber magnatum TaxID=42249 RepID=A0A317SUC0_9PEZI|nr:hypothetical protein C7212DRAFT_362348 [Tuber magnatum]